MRSFKIITFLWALIATIFVGLAISSFNDWNPFATVAGMMVLGLCTFVPDGVLAVVIGNVLKSTVTGAGGSDKQDILYIIDADEISTWPTRAQHDASYAGSFVMASGKYMYKLYVTASSIKVGYETEGDPDKKGFVHTLEAEHPGDSTQIKEFLNYFLNRNIVVIWERCSDGTKQVLGTKCAPLQMVPKGENDKDKNVNMLTLKGIAKTPFGPGYYTGGTTLTSVMGTPAAGATSVDVAAGEGEYQLTTGSSSAATITTMTNAVHGKVYTLLGSGGTYPSTITAANDFILKDGTTWTASAGARITVQAFKSGASAWKFVEVSRS
jgi:hypothetical protein